jgi:archaellum biogenesis protein FlaJ (TadC family)
MYSSVLTGYSLVISVVFELILSLCLQIVPRHSLWSVPYSTLVNSLVCSLTQGVVEYSLFFYFGSSGIAYLRSDTQKDQVE